MTYIYYQVNKLLRFRRGDFRKKIKRFAEEYFTDSDKLDLSTPEGLKQLDDDVTAITKVSKRGLIRQMSNLNVFVVGS